MALAEGSEEIQAEIEAPRKREEVVAREIEEIAGEEPLECTLETFKGKKEAGLRGKGEKSEKKKRKKREWEREKQMREQLVETERVKKQGQAALERKGGDKEGKRGVEKSDIGRQDWDQQPVQRQMALTEQRERYRIDERRIEYRGSGGDEQGIGERIRLTEGMERETMRNMREERRSLKKRDRVSSFRPRLMEILRKASCRRQ